jgi:hypothetical protein
VLRVYLVLICSVRCTLDSALDHLKMKRRLGVCRSFYQLVAVGIDNLDIVVGDAVSPPV